MKRTRGGKSEVSRVEMKRKSISDFEENKGWRVIGSRKRVR